MDHATPTDRRHPRVGVHDLRRDLRDADHDRYRLAAELEQHRRSRTTSNRLLGAMIIVAGGFTSGLWFTLPGRVHAGTHHPAEASSAALPATAPVIANERTSTVETAAAPAVSIPVESDPQGPATTDAKRQSPAAVVRRQRRPAPVNSVNAAGGRRQIGVDRRADAGRANNLRRSRPRPLSPGEFGRQASL
jgi:hypothetical protein